MPQLPQEEQEARSAQLEAHARATNLLASPDFRWFMAEAIEKPLQEAERDALDVNKTNKQCRLAREKRKLLSDLKGWLVKRQQTAQEFTAPN